MLTLAHCCQYCDYIHTFIRALCLFGSLCQKVLYKVASFWFVRLRWRSYEFISIWFFSFQGQLPVPRWAFDRFLHLATSLTLLERLWPMVGHMIIMKFTMITLERCLLWPLYQLCPNLSLSLLLLSTWLHSWPFDLFPVWSGNSQPLRCLARSYVLYMLAD